MLWQYALIMIAIAVAIVLQSDADLPLMLMSYKEDSAFTGQVIWIAGASSGIGASLAENMVRAGALVIISARRMSQLEDVANFCGQFGTRPFVLEMDMTSLESQEQAFKIVMDKFGRIDSLVLNAGQSQRNVAVETSLEVTHQLMNLNFMSYVSLTKLVVPAMIARRQGQVTQSCDHFESLSHHISSDRGDELPVRHYRHAHRLFLLRLQVRSGRTFRLFCLVFSMY
jgi:hypothetical protein